MTILELQSRMESSAATARALTEFYLERIAEIDKQRPALNAVIELNPASLTDWVNGDTHPLISSTPAAVAGCPNITVPAGYIHGLPVGISFFSSAYQEPTLSALPMPSSRPPRFAVHRSFCRPPH